MFICCAAFIFSCVACSTTGGNVYVGEEPPPPAGPHYPGDRHSRADRHPGSGPPSHAPAHGYRAKHNYNYYPEVSVYFDIDRNVYFYQEGDRWRISAHLPDHIRVRVGDHVVITMDSDRPYRDYRYHKAKYPPGQMKKKKKKKHWKTGPPPHAPAHGYRAKHTYHYYPRAEVYFDINRKIYFYQGRDGWTVSAQLSDRFRARLGDHVVITMDTDKPYTNVGRHKGKYPPGQMKKKKKKKHWKDY